MQADAGDVASLVPHVEGCGMVVNLALGDFGRVVSDAMAVHQACRKAAVPLLVHMSSAAVFGRADIPDLTENSAPLRGIGWNALARKQRTTRGCPNSLPAPSRP